MFRLHAHLPDENLGAIARPPGHCLHEQLCKDTNCPQFFITTGDGKFHLDGVNQAFGRVVKGMDVVHKFEEYVEDRKTSTLVGIVSCGELSEEEEERRRRKQKLRRRRHE